MKRSKRGFVFFVSVCIALTALCIGCSNDSDSGSSGGGNGSGGGGSSGGGGGSSGGEPS